MATQDILKYFEDNKKSFPLETLIAQLRIAGYPEQEISLAVEKFKDTTDSPLAASKDTEYSIFQKIRGFINGFVTCLFLYLIMIFLSEVFNVNYFLPRILINLFILAIIGTIYYFNYYKQRLYTRIGFGVGAAILLISSVPELFGLYF